MLTGCSDGTDEATTDRAAASVRSEPAPAANPDPGLPAQASVGPVYGNPADASTQWVEQSYEDCGLMAVATIVGLVTGQAPTEQDIIDIASNTPKQDGSGPIYHPPQSGDDTTDNGTSREDQVRLLKHFGVAATATDDDIAAAGGSPTGLEALQQYLGAGRKAIVGSTPNTPT